MSLLYLILISSNPAISVNFYQKSKGSKPLIREKFLYCKVGFQPTPFRELNVSYAKFTNLINQQMVSGINYNLCRTDKK